MPAIEIENSSRVYRTGKRRRSREEGVALDAVSLDVRAGEIHGLPGPSGAARVAGDAAGDAAEVRKRIGIVFGGARASTSGSPPVAPSATGRPSTTWRGCCWRRSPSAVRRGGPPRGSIEFG